MQKYSIIHLNKYDLCYVWIFVGVYHEISDAELYIDVTSIPELRSYKATDDSLSLGANMTLTNAMKVFSETAAKYPKFKYLQKLTTHIDLVAHVPVRNFGSLAGNLSIKHAHNEFPSDIFLILTAVDAQLEIGK